MFSSYTHCDTDAIAVATASHMNNETLASQRWFADIALDLRAGCRCNHAIAVANGDHDVVGVRVEEGAC